MENSASNAGQTGHPKGLYLLFFTEMWERVSYYGMRAIFILFMTKMIGFEDQEASSIYGSYTGLVYLTPLLGGYLSDKYLGNKKSILTGGVLMAIGQFLMFFSASSSGDTAINFMWMGLTVLIIGNGFFKPNISTMVGQLYEKGDARVDGAFTIFYMGINLGAAIGPIICGYFAENIDFKWGFFSAGVGMIIGLFTFMKSKDKLLVNNHGAQLGNQVHKIDAKAIGMIVGAIAAIYLMLNFKAIFKVDADVISWFIYGSIILMPIVILTNKTLTKEEMSRISVIFILSFFVIFFWGAFEQTGASLTLFADRQTDREIFGWTMPTAYLQSVNAVAIILLATPMSILWLKLNKKKMEPSSPKKMAWGLAFVALGFLVIAYAVNGIIPTAKISVFWLILVYLLHTIGELCLSPIGLSMVSKLSPIRFSALLMGTWFLATAAGNKFAGQLSTLIPSEGKATSFAGFQITNLHEFFMLFVVICTAAAALLFVLSGYLEKNMKGIK
jgi:proton-dependent oligopeptide transporter, POT family